MSVVTSTKEKKRFPHFSIVSFQVVFSQTSDLAEQPPIESLPSSSKDSMTSENLYQTFVSKHFDFLNEEVRP